LTGDDRLPGEFTATAGNVSDSRRAGTADEAYGSKVLAAMRGEKCEPAIQFVIETAWNNGGSFFPC
jgi:hypothetical protein